MTPSVGKARQAVHDALNGDYDNVDSAIRRSLLALATELDEHQESVEKQHEAMVADRVTAFNAMEAAIGKLRMLLVSTAMTFMATLVAAVVNLMVG
jgi:hypothetical protein